MAGHGTTERSEDRKNKQNDCTQKAARAVVVKGGGGMAAVQERRQRMQVGRRRIQEDGCVRRAHSSRSTGLGRTCPPQLLQVCKHLVDPGVILQTSLEDDM